MDLDRVIIEPILTEKSNTLRERHKYCFKIDSRANKIEVVKALKKAFGVHPVKCNIITVKRKPKKVRYRPGYTSAWKKAIVTLPENETFSIFEGA